MPHLTRSVRLRKGDPRPPARPPLGGLFVYGRDNPRAIYIRRDVDDHLGGLTTRLRRHAARFFLDEGALARQAGLADGAKVALRLLAALRTVSNGAPNWKATEAAIAASAAISPMAEVTIGSRTSSRRIGSLRHLFPEKGQQRRSRHEVAIWSISV
jgi:hypothetical protein